MGLSYTSSVFFGTYVPRESKLGKRLYKYIDKNEGSPAPTKTMGVEIGCCGSLNGDPQFITIQIDDVDLRVRRDDPIAAPRPLPDTTGWGARIAACLAAEKIDDTSVAPIGWYFEGSVW